MCPNNILKQARGLLFSLFIAILTTEVLIAAPTPTAKTHPVTISVATTIPVETTLNRKLTPSAADTWVDMINHAESSLDFGEFYLTGGDKAPLNRVVQAILKAKQRGVHIRILVDGKMKKNSLDMIAFFKKAGIPVAILNWGELTGGVLHAKYFIADRKVVYIGSQNFDWRSLKHIHETGLEIANPEIADAAGQIFEADWAYANGQIDIYKKLAHMKPVVSSLKNIQLVASPGRFNPPGVDAALPELLKLINAAQKHITIQLLSYSTHRYRSDKRFTDIDTALRNAAKRGVTIDMLVSNWNKRKHGVADLKSLSAVPGITVKFANIPQASEGFIPYARVIHSKVMRVDDDICWVGTSNWAYDYFYASRNLEIVLRDPAVAHTLDGLFQNLWTSPYTETVKADGQYKPPRIY